MRTKRDCHLVIKEAQANLETTTAQTRLALLAVAAAHCAAAATEVDRWAWAECVESIVDKSFAVVDSEL